MRRYEKEIGRDPDGEGWIQELEAAGRTAAFFLLLPVLLVALLLTGCGDSGGDSAVRSVEDANSKMSTPGRLDPASNPGPVGRPGPSRSSDPAEPTEPGETKRPGESKESASDEAETFTGPVSFASAEEAYDRGRFDEAHRMFSAYTTQYPDNPWGFYMTGLSAWKKGDLDTAEKSLEKTVEMDSSHVKGWVNLARVRLDAGRPGDARKAVSRARGLEGGETADVFRVTGLVSQEEGELDEASEAYRQALMLDPADAWSMNNLALIHIRRGDFEKALPPLARAVEIREDVPVFQNNLGTALEKMGRFTAAARAYRKADELGDGYEKARASLARVEGLKEPPGLKPTDLSEFARGFVDEMEAWRLDRTASNDPEIPGDGEVESRVPGDGGSDEGVGSVVSAPPQSSEDTDGNEDSGSEVDSVDSGTSADSVENVEVAGTDGPIDPVDSSTTDGADHSGEEGGTSEPR